MCPTTALWGEPCGRGARNRDREDIGAFLISLPQLRALGQASVPSGTVPAFPGLGFHFLLQFWAEARALLFLWGAGGVVISSLKRISHQRDRDRSGGDGEGGRMGSM